LLKSSGRSFHETIFPLHRLESDSGGKDLILPEQDEVDKREIAAGKGIAWNRIN
jgi:hypothetical protein